MKEAEYIYNKLIASVESAMNDFEKSKDEQHKKILLDYIDNTLQLAAELGVAKLPPNIKRIRNTLFIDDELL